jgi:hypothetical protein
MTLDKSRLGWQKVMCPSCGGLDTNTQNITDTEANSYCYVCKRITWRNETKDGVTTEFHVAADDPYTYHVIGPRR